MYLLQKTDCMRMHEEEARDAEEKVRWTSSPRMAVTADLAAG